MQSRRNYSLAERIFGLGLACLACLSHAAPLIVLPAGEITRLSYVGQEFFDDRNGNHLPDRGDVFKGVVNITRIQGAAPTQLLVLLGMTLGLSMRKFGDRSG
jgi:hypothetical protein